MGASLGFFLNLDRCVACQACAVACKAYHLLAPGVQWRHVVNVWAGQYPAPLQRTLSYSCMHCGQPSCLRACPVGAISQRPEDGLVLVDGELCIGCRACGEACPYGVPQFEADGTMSKCDLCADRLALGEQPICVGTCPSDALLFGSLDALAALVYEKQGAIARLLSGQNQPAMRVYSAHWSALEPLLPWRGQHS